MSSGINSFGHDIEIKFYLCCMNESCDDYGNEYLDTEARLVTCYHDNRYSEGEADYTDTCPKCGVERTTYTTETRLDCFSGEY